MLTKELLRSLREQKGLTGKQVAEGIGIAYPVYQTYESGARNAGLPVVEKLADFYGVTTDYLLGREPAPNPFADMGLSEASEQDMLSQYMSFPPEVRAVLMDALIKLADSAKPEAPLEIVEETTVGAELDRMEALTEDEAKSGA